MNRQQRPFIVIDNYDSFTFNVVAQFRCLLGAFAPLLVFKNDEIEAFELFLQNPQAIVLGPGPGDERAGGISRECLTLAASRRLPVLGVCLGHQMIGSWSGARVIRAHYPCHGKTAAIEHTGCGIFKGLPKPCSVARYHSLVLCPTTMPERLLVDARTEEGEIMAIHHRDYPFFGVQFHPESFLSEEGNTMIRNFIDIALNESASSSRLHLNIPSLKSS